LPLIGLGESHRETALLDAIERRRRGAASGKGRPTQAAIAILSSSYQRHLPPCRPIAQRGLAVMVP
jgi:hypothetical protein